MLLLPAVLALGVIVGWLLGGRIKALAEVRIRWWWLAPIALALQAAPARSRLLGTALLLGSYGLLVVLAAANLGAPAFWAVLVGVAMNLVVIAANGGMPVSRSAAERIGGEDGVRALQSGEDRKHHLADEESRLLPLADVVPVPGFGVVVSAGDVLAYGGAAAFVAWAMRGYRPRRAAARRARSGSPR